MIMYEVLRLLGVELDGMLTCMMKSKDMKPNDICAFEVNIPASVALVCGRTKEDIIKGKRCNVRDSNQTFRYTRHAVRIGPTSWELR
jgi:hypothetical protein